MLTEFRDPDNQRLRVFDRNRGALLVIDDGSNLPQYSQQFRATEEQLQQLASRFAPPDPGPPRPDDTAELARLVAVKLRAANVYATKAGFGDAVVETVRVCASDKYRTTVRYYNMYAPQFNNLTPKECADVIQREEAARAAEWAGDK